MRLVIWSAARRRGFTLVEVMVALVLLGLVSTVIYRALISTQRVADALSQRGALQSGLRAAGLIVPAELQSLALGTSTSLDSISDIRAITDTSITYRAMRAFYTVCQTPGSATALVVVRTQPSGFASEYRAPSSGDSAQVFWEGDTLTASDDRWIPVGISSVATGTCSYPSSPVTTLNSYTLGLVSPGIPSGFALGKLYPGAPVRTYETVTLTSYASGGSQWLGMNVAGAGVQPLAGPLAGSNGTVYGFGLTYYDSTGAVLTASAANIPKIRSIGVILRGVTADQVATSGTTRALVYDSLMAVITLRNAPRN